MDRAARDLERAAERLVRTTNRLQVAHHRQILCLPVVEHLEFPTQLDIHHFAADPRVPGHREREIFHADVAEERIRATQQWPESHERRVDGVQERVVVEVYDNGGSLEFLDEERALVHPQFTRQDRSPIRSAEPHLTAQQARNVPTIDALESVELECEVEPGVGGRVQRDRARDARRSTCPRSSIHLNAAILRKHERGAHVRLSHAQSIDSDSRTFHLQRAGRRQVVGGPSKLHLTVDAPGHVAEPFGEREQHSQRKHVGDHPEVDRFVWDAEPERIEDQSSRDPARQPHDPPTALDDLHLAGKAVVAIAQRALKRSESKVLVPEIVCLEASRDLGLVCGPDHRHIEAHQAFERIRELK